MKRTHTDPTRWYYAIWYPHAQPRPMWLNRVVSMRPRPSVRIFW